MLAANGRVEGQDLVGREKRAASGLSDACRACPVANQPRGRVTRSTTRFANQPDVASKGRDKPQRARRIPRVPRSGPNPENMGPWAMPWAILVVGHQHQLRVEAGVVAGRAQTPTTPPR